MPPGKFWVVSVGELGDDAFKIGVDHGTVERPAFTDDPDSQHDPARGPFADPHQHRLAVSERQRPQINPLGNQEVEGYVGRAAAKQKLVEERVANHPSSTTRIEDLALWQEIKHRIEINRPRPRETGRASVLRTPFKARFSSQSGHRNYKYFSPGDYVRISGLPELSGMSARRQSEELMPTFASQLSNDQLMHLTQKSVARASRKYGAGFMQAALNETDRLSGDQLQRLVEMPDFGEAVASWYGAYLFFTSGGWQRWKAKSGA